VVAAVVKKPVAEHSHAVAPVLTVKLAAQVEHTAVEEQVKHPLAHTVYVKVEAV